MIVRRKRKQHKERETQLANAYSFAGRCEQLIRGLSPPPSYLYQPTSSFILAQRG